MDRFELLDDHEKIAAIDKSGMLQVALNLPAQLSEALALAQKVKAPKYKNIKNIVIAGMGGSAISGNLVADLLAQELNLPIFVNRSYECPAFVGKDTLFFAVSYSGNTEETLAALAQAQKSQAKIVCVTSDGKLKEKQINPTYLIPGGLQPRAAIAYLLVPILVCLESSGIAKGLSQQIIEAAALLERQKSAFGLSVATRNNLAKQLAKKLLGKTPIVFASKGTTESAGLRLKTQLNENSKLNPLFNVFPELDHNEIVGLAKLSRAEHNSCLVILRDEKDSERLKKRIEVTKSLIGRQLGGAQEVWSKGKSHLARLLSLVYFGDILSVYLAILRNVDPTPVEAIERLKKELSR
ncbi:MAG: bifunctional phosphoglucose/phosphomannose isomerase [bacterium]